eukprot:TRINITY_DN4342_c0_g1_i12.p2 TRINITY_DN4342_c0_g1~~TRINITY_DN4342_c0_g1_i12.p2  ORF type:complete len:457 (+),score=53.28 TRINITY_DN4342_c0_g1_i12:80-1450(+)
MLPFSKAITTTPSNGGGIDPNVRDLITDCSTNTFSVNTLNQQLVRAIGSDDVNAVSVLLQLGGLAPGQPHSIEQQATRERLLQLALEQGSLKVACLLYEKGVTTSTISGTQQFETSSMLVTPQLPPEFCQVPEPRLGSGDMMLNLVQQTSPFPAENSPSPLEKEEYCTDKFRMYEFKVLLCTNEEEHDWMECPFGHPGEKACRRDPRKFNYVGTACPDFRKGSCKRGDSCGYAHGVFECWLHPSRYRTQLCQAGMSCNRKVCFFAHHLDQLRAPDHQPFKGHSASAKLKANAQPKMQPEPVPMQQVSKTEVQAPQILGLSTNAVAVASQQPQPSNACIQRLSSLCQALQQEVYRSEVQAPQMSAPRVMAVTASQQPPQPPNAYIQRLSSLCTAFQQFGVNGAVNSNGVFNMNGLLGNINIPQSNISEMFMLLQRLNGSQQFDCVQENSTRVADGGL